MREGWEDVELGDIAAHIKGSAAIEADSRYEVWSVPSFSDGTPESVLGSTIGSAKIPVKPGDVLLCKINPRINRVWVVGERDNSEQIASPEWITLRIKDRLRVDPNFLCKYLSSPRFRKWIAGNVKGATGSHTRAKPREVMNQMVPLPPLREQRRIVAILDEAFAAIAKAMENTERNRENANAAANSHLDDVFSRELIAWPGKPLESLTTAGSPITYGVVKPGPEGSIRFVRGGDVYRGTIATEKLRTITETVSAQYRRTLLQGGELLVSLVGQPGETAVAPLSLAGANIARQVGLVRLQPEINAHYISFFLQSGVGRQLLTSRQGGSVQQVINLRDLREVPVPVAPYEHQAAVVSTVSSQLLEFERLGLLSGTRITLLHDLKQSLLHHAFTGQLTAKSADRMLTEASV